MSALWTAGGSRGRDRRARSGARRAARGVCIDSRSLEPGDLFVALEGENRDGHDFVAAALAKRRGGRDRQPLPGGLGPEAPLLVVPDTLAGLEALGRAGRAPRRGARIVGVTGSVGKTGTKEALRHVLSAQGVTHATCRQPTTTTGACRSASPACRGTRDYGVFELGMNHPARSPAHRQGPPPRRPHHH